MKQTKPAQAMELRSLSLVFDGRRGVAGLPSLQGGGTSVEAGQVALWQVGDACPN